MTSATAAPAATARLPWVVGALCLAGFIATVWLANWLLLTYGIVTVPFGLDGPAGVYAAGLAFGLRDAVHETLGRWWVLVGIAAGAALTLIIESTATLPGGLVPLAAASAAAFALSELADLAVYSPLRRSHWAWGVAASNAVGALIDTFVFLLLAFGTTAAWQGQVVGKTTMIALSLPIVWYARRALTARRA